MKKQNAVLVSVFMLTVSAVYAQKNTNDDITYKRCFVGSTLFLLGNLDTKNPPGFVQLNLGYRITPEDVISIEVKTWKYAWSLGIPYGKSYEAPQEKFPGYIREYGIAVAYQRFLWKGLYTAIHVMNAKQTFVDENRKKLKNGYQMFNTYRLGYQFKFFKNRFFLEPSIAVTHRPIQSKMPAAFERLNDKWPKYFIGEPGLHFGYNF